MLKIGQSVFSGTPISALRRRRPEPNRSVRRAKKMMAPVRPAVSPEVGRRPRTVRSRRAPSGPCQEIHFGRFSAQRRSFSCREIHSGRFSAHPALRAWCAWPARGADGHRAGRVPGRGGARGTPPSRLRGLDPLPLTAGRCTFLTFVLWRQFGAGAGVRCIFSGLLHASGGGPARPIPLRRRPGEGLRTGSTSGGCAFPQFGGSLSSRGSHPRPVRGRRERARETRTPCPGRAKLAKRCIGVATGCRGRTKVPQKVHRDAGGSAAALPRAPAGRASVQLEASRSKPAPIAAGQGVAAARTPTAGAAGPRPARSAICGGFVRRTSRL